MIHMYLYRLCGVAGCVAVAANISKHGWPPGRHRPGCDLLRARILSRRHAGQANHKLGDSVPHYVRGRSLIGRVQILQIARNNHQRSSSQFQTGNSGLAFLPLRSLAKDAPVHRAAQPPACGTIVAVPHVGGLHHHYERRAA